MNITRFLFLFFDRKEESGGDPSFSGFLALQAEILQGMTKSGPYVSFFQSSTQDPPCLYQLKYQQLKLE